MKMTKKIMLAAVAMAAVMVSSCSIGDVMIKSAGSGTGTRKYTVNATNEPSEKEIESEGYDENPSNYKKIVRGMRHVGAAGRAGGTCVIKIKDQTASDKDGVMGFVCGFEKISNPDKENDGFVNFLVIGVQNNGGTTRYYASYYCNIDTNNLSAENFGAGTDENPVTKTEYDLDEVKPYEIVIKPWTNISAAKIKDGILEVAIDTTGKADGGYNIKLYKADDYEVKTQSAQLIPLDGKSPIQDFDVDANKIGRDENSKNGGLYCYVNIQPWKTMNGSWDIYDTTFKKSKAAFEDAGWIWSDPESVIDWE